MVLSFQSAPLTKARGDSQSAVETTRHYSFNPLPSQKQGETPQAPVVYNIYDVSIRSPHKSKGRQKMLARFCSVQRFQSAPLTKARGDNIPSPGSTSSKSFNPLPSQKQGETSAQRHQIFSSYQFQSAPLTKARGDESSHDHADPLPSFNPLPSQKQGETPLCDARSPPAEPFQSAPLTKARGDAKIPKPRSPPMVFQSAPLTKARGDVLGAVAIIRVTAFQSAPLTKARGDRWSVI